MHARALALQRDVGVGTGRQQRLAPGDAGLGLEGLAREQVGVEPADLVPEPRVRVTPHVQPVDLVRRLGGVHGDGGRRPTRARRRGGLQQQLQRQKRRSPRTRHGWRHRGSPALTYRACPSSSTAAAIGPHPPPIVARCREYYCAELKGIIGELKKML